MWRCDRLGSRQERVDNRINRMPSVFNRRENTRIITDKASDDFCSVHPFFVLQLAVLFIIVGHYETIIGEECPKLREFINLITSPIHLAPLSQLTQICVQDGKHAEKNFSSHFTLLRWIIRKMLLPRNRLRPLIPIHVPPLQLLDEAHQALGESVEHGVRGIGEVCGVECLDGCLEFREHSGDLVGEVFLLGQVGEEGGQSGVDGLELGGVLGVGEMFGEVEKSEIENRLQIGSKNGCAIFKFMFRCHVLQPLMIFFQSLEEAFEAGVQIVVDYRFHFGNFGVNQRYQGSQVGFVSFGKKLLDFISHPFEGVFGGFEKRFVELLYGELDILFSLNRSAIDRINGLGQRIVCRSEI
ncbi:methylcrotonoylcarboxylase beta mitochondrial Q9V9A7, putative [Babesia ovata]|uniref:Methylcrotonoylcarboxylase beta mitochondrial Q9V9A7, putative n=1 Tax=Babesia ovata TaxID=189622 RepID=A0A2H6KJP6_9APIC|nr:methylcrotonoylcarboxylase beta mitochondrial Q9V9A7, putative [Babesia ovata]GBE63200.1 methylcrotonoylcarboxylase beta mitochondrial Q9V9A7, putative [Babesia ovata]